MNQRIHEVLDGSLDSAELSAAELRELESVRAATHAAAERLGRARSPGLSDSVMQGLRERSEGGWIRGLWTPRTVAIRPVWGLLAAAAVAGLLLLPGVELPNGNALLPESENVTVFVQFRLHAPDASQVQLAGSFTGWEPAHDLRPTDDGFWAVLIPMEPGIHDYAFVVDGTEWTPDPSAPRVDDGFGGENSRLALLLVNGARGS